MPAAALAGRCEEITTRDVFQQVDTRLTRVEDELRQLRSDSNAGFAQLNLRFDQLQWRLVGLFVLTWVTVIGSIWLKA